MSNHFLSSFYFNHFVRSWSNTSEHLVSFLRLKIGFTLFVNGPPLGGFPKFVSLYNDDLLLQYIPTKPKTLSLILVLVFFYYIGLSSHNSTSRILLLLITNDR